MSALITNPAIKSLLRGLLVWAPLWIFTTILFGCTGAFYVFVLKSDTYLASQGLLVRDEANGAVMRLGRFQSQTELKAAQEIILEMAKSPPVIREALIAAGKPPSLFSWFGWSDFSGDYPSEDLVTETAKQAVLVHAPKGTEFGTTEVIYLDIKANSREQALQLNKSVCDALEARLQQVRKVRADGVISELITARDSARNALKECTSALNEIEREAGADLTDLRGMTDTVAGGATSRAELEQIKSELRQVEATKQALLSDREMLVNASGDPNGFLTAPGTILNSHPGLKRMREGLVDAQITGANILGKYTPNHPTAITSLSAQESISRQFVKELRAAVTSVDSDISLANKKIERLESQKKIAEERLSKLAKGRANYANLVSEVKSRSSILESSEKELAEAQAARDSAMSTSLLTRLDAPVVSDKPIGPGKTTLAGLCAIAGLIFGLGIVFVITPIDLGPTFGRRAQDRLKGRRAADSGTDVNPPSSAVQDRTIADPTVSDVSNALKTTTPERPNLPEGNQPTRSQRAPKPAVNSPVTIQQQSHQAHATLHIACEELPMELEHAKQFEISPASANDGNKGSVLVNTRDIESISMTSKPSLLVTGNETVDEAFRELAKLKAFKTEKRGEELAIQMKIQELESDLSSLGHKTDTESLRRVGWTIPRPTQNPSQG